MLHLVQSVLNDAEKHGKLDKKVSSFFERNAPNMITNSLEKFAERMGQTLETLTPENIDEFKQSELPKVLENVLSDTEQIEHKKKENK